MKILSKCKKAVFDKSRQYDSSGALADTNENREIAADNFYNEENVKENETKNEFKKVYEISSRLKKIKLRIIELNNKTLAKKLRKKLQHQHRPSKSIKKNYKINKEIWICFQIFFMSLLHTQ